MKCFLLIGLVMLMSCSNNSIVVSIQDKPLNEVRDQLFGQFLERAGKGEPGPDAALGSDGRRLDKRVVELLEKMEIPLIRYPGGGHLVHMGPWFEFVDNYPSTGDKRKQPKAFGYHEYLELAEHLGAQSVLPVNFRKGLWGEIPLEEAAQHAAGLVAYCNAPVGAALPEGMIDWPGIRKANGHEKPFGIEWFQIGNEWFVYFDALAKVRGIADLQEQIKHAKKCLHTYVDAMKAVDPGIKVILEGTYWAPHQATVVEALVSDPELRKRFGHVSYHLYKPWFKHLVKRNGEKVDPETLSEEETWYALVGTPMTDDEGRSVLRPDVLFGKTHRGRVLEWAEKYGWRVAMTEWNWNGWGGPKNVGKSLTTRGIGAAGFLNAIIRKGGIVELATQSMMVGRGWPFSSVHLKPDPHPHLCGQVTALYSRYHGNQRLFSKTSNVPVRDQLLEWGEIGCSRKVAVLDIVVTSDANALYLHCINRDFEKDYTISPTLDGRPCAGPAVRHTLAGDMSALANAKDCRQSAEVVSETVTGSPLKIFLPSKSVSVVVIPLRKD